MISPIKLLFHYRRIIKTCQIQSYHFDSRYVRDRTQDTPANKLCAPKETFAIFDIVGKMHYNSNYIMQNKSENIGRLIKMHRKSKLVFNEYRQPAIVFLSIALALFLAFIGFFAWHTARMRSYALKYVRMEGTVVDVEKQLSSSGPHHTSQTYYYLVISYTYEGQTYTFTDRVGHNYNVYNKIGTSTEIYVNPQNPRQAEKATSSDFVSIICACFFAFFCVTYATGMNVLLCMKGSTFKKRFLFVWGTEILLGIAFLLLFWLGLPHSGFGEVFVRIKGAVGITVVCGLVLCVALLDGLITRKLHWKVAL